MNGSILLSSQVYAVLYLSSLLALLLASMLLFVYLRRQLELAKLANKHSNELPEKNALASYTSPVEATIKAVDELVHYIHREKPDYIVGVHTGGRLASSLVCKKAGITSNRCVFISTDVSPDREPKIRGLNEKLRGRVLFVDDVTRTGSTLELIRRKTIRDGFIKKNFVKTALFATIFVGTENRRKLNGGYFLPDWWMYTTENPDQSLPWSILSAYVRTAYSCKNQGRNYDEYYIALHDRIVTDFEFATYCADLAINENDRFFALVEEKKLDLAYDTHIAD